jgi:hypothetical protein
MGRKRRVVCGFFGGILIRLAFDAPTALMKVACVTMAVFLIILGAISDEKLAKIKAERRKEWYEKDWSDEEEKWK